MKDRGRQCHANSGGGCCGREGDSGEQESNVTLWQSAGGKPKRAQNAVAGSGQSQKWRGGGNALQNPEALAQFGDHLSSISEVLCVAARAGIAQFVVVQERTDNEASESKECIGKHQGENEVNGMYDQI